MNNLQGKAFVYKPQQHTIYHTMNKMNDYQWMNQTNQNADAVFHASFLTSLCVGEDKLCAPVSSFPLFATVYLHNPKHSPALIDNKRLLV